MFVRFNTCKIFITLLLFSFTVSAFTQTTPDQLVKSITDEVLNIIKNDKDIQSGNAKKVTILVDNKVAPYFDFTKMTKLVMGKYWHQATDEQKEQILKEFRILLIRTYSISLIKYVDQNIDFYPAQYDGGDIVVRSRIKGGTGPHASKQPISIDYRMGITADGWKAFDIKVNGISLVASYKNTFSNSIENNGIEGLIQELLNKNR